MKTLHQLPFFAVLAILTSCSGRQPLKVNIDSVSNHLGPGKHSFVAAFEKDTAKLNLDITPKGQITGHLAVNYKRADTIIATRESTNGNLTGEFKGDTLMVDYYFTCGTNKDVKYINPVALLHRGDTLIMGNGRIYSYLGRTYFDPHTPIDFKKSKFRFLPVKK